MCIISVLNAYCGNNAYYVRIKGVLLSQRITKYAPVAQLDRVTDSDSVGRWFESSRAYQIPKSCIAFGDFY